MHAGGPGVKLVDDIHLSWPESFSLLLGLSGSVPGNSFGVRPKFGMRIIAKISNAWAQTRGLQNILKGNLWTNEYFSILSYNQIRTLTRFRTRNNRFIY